MELVVLIALLGILCGITILSVANKPATVRDVKLSSDIATLNQMAAVYVSDGGSLDGLTSAQAVLDRMKRVRPQTEWKRHTGPATGRLIDTRLRARTTNAPEYQQQQRALWNVATKRFEMTTASGPAVAEFFLDESLSNTDFGTENRKAPNVKYNTAQRGWVWGNTGTTSDFAYLSSGNLTTNGKTDPFNPSENEPAPPTDPGGGTGGNEGGGSGGETGGGGNPPAATKLNRPNINPSGGTYSYSNYPTSVSVSPNGAPGGTSSKLMYRLGGGAWTEYTGPLTVPPGTSVEAQNIAIDTALYKDSNTNSMSYYRLVQGFTGTGTGTWGNATGGSNLVTTTENGSTTSTFKHGNTKLDLGNGEFLDAGIENVLTFTPKGFETVVPNNWFNLGNLTMLNGTTFYSSEADRVTLSINLNLSEPSKTGVVHINFGLISTENSSDRMASADIVELQNPTTDFRVTIDGVQYRLELSWATLDPGAGVAQGNQFLIFEGASAQAELRARFVSDR